MPCQELTCNPGFPTYAEAIEAEFRRFVVPLDVADELALPAVGYTFHFNAPIKPLGVGHVEFRGARFGWKRSGDAAYCLLAVHYGVVRGIVAFTPDGQRVASQDGQPTCLGQETIISESAFGGAVPVYRNAVAWMQNDCRGVFTIEPRMLYLDLHGVQRVIVPTVEEGKWLQRHLKPPAYEPPQIMVADE